jgi:hypothetical protein
MRTQGHLVGRGAGQDGAALDPDTFWLAVAALLFAACGLVWLIGQVAAIVFGPHHQHLPVRLVDMLGVLLRLPGTWDDPARAWPPSSQPLLPGPVGMYAAAILTFWLPALTYGLLVRLVSPRARRRRRQRGAKWASWWQLRRLLVLGPRRGRIILGRRDRLRDRLLGRLYLAVEQCHSVLAFGPPGSFKTHGLVIPAILEWQGNLVTTSIKPDVLRAIGAAEFGKVDLSYRLGERPEEVVYCNESVQHRLWAKSERDVARRQGVSDSEVLPELDPAEMKSSVGAKAADYAVGDMIDGRFEILDVLGQGGFSKVYRVRDEVEGEERAFKLFDNAAGYEAVRREIGALRKIRHPNVVEVFWAGKTSTGNWYLITEFIDGESLDGYATGKRHMRDREAIDVTLDVLEALVAIHPNSARLEELDHKRHDGELSEAEYAEWMELQDRGLVHRDIKPLNVMLTRTGAKLLDFNIASRVGDPVYTQSGTPSYQAPDADLTRWDVSTDLFAVGVMLYELLCNGQHPYPNSKPMAGESAINPRTVRPDLDSHLADFLVKACAPYRSERFTTAQEMKDALSAIRRKDR